MDEQRFTLPAESAGGARRILGIGPDPDTGNPPTADPPVARPRGTELPCADGATRFKTVISMS